MVTLEDYIIRSFRIQVVVPILVLNGCVLEDNCVMVICNKLIVSILVLDGFVLEGRNRSLPG